MAKPKSKKTDKKSTPKADAPKSKAEVKEVKEVKAPVVAEATVVEKTVASGEEKPLKGFFARKYDANENVLTIFKSPRVWGFCFLRTRENSAEFFFYGFTKSCQ